MPARLPARLRPGAPFVIAQLGQTLDGRIATHTGESKYINGPSALDHLHALRAAVDAVVVGIGTVLADDPALTVRRTAGRAQQVIIDPNARLPEDAKCLCDDGARVLVVRPQRADWPNGSKQSIVAPAADGLCPHGIVDELFARGFRKILDRRRRANHLAVSGSRRARPAACLLAPMIIGSGKPGLDCPDREFNTGAAPAHARLPAAGR